MSRTHQDRLAIPTLDRITSDVPGFFTYHGHRPHDSKAYNLLTDGTQHQLRENFRLHEFQCSDGTPILLAHPAMLNMLQALRDELGLVKVASGYRTYAHNEGIEGSAEHSRHLWGLAADVVVPRMPPSSVTRWAEQHEVGGIGYYERFTHLDVQGRNRRWGPRLSS